MPDTTVKYFNSAMTGAPALDNTAGSAIGVLDACLVNGFGSVTLDSLVVAGDVATGTLSTGHGFAMVGATGPVITIAGATPAGLNGEWRLASVPGTTTFTFATTGITNQTATGTITAKRSPAGFSKAFSGTNKAAYRGDAIVSNRLYLRIDDTATNSSRLCGYETMSDVDTGTGLFPTDAQISGGGYLYKATSTGCAWTLFSDGFAIYFFCDAAGSGLYRGGFFFGDPLSYVAADAFGTMLIASSGATSDFPLFYLTDSSGVSTSGYLARPYTQIGTSQRSYRYSHGRALQMAGQGQPYPALTGNAFHAWPVDYWEDNANARGLMPGLWNPLHTANPSHATIIESIANLPNRTLFTQRMASSYRAAIDITGPWR